MYAGVALRGFVPCQARVAESAERLAFDPRVCDRVLTVGALATPCRFILAHVYGLGGG